MVVFFFLSSVTNRELFDACLSVRAEMAHKQDGSIFHKVQLTTFAILFAGYASYTYNRKAVSFALPSLMKSGLLDKSGAGKTQDLILFFFY